MFRGGWKEKEVSHITQSSQFLRAKKEIAINPKVATNNFLCALE